MFPQNMHFFGLRSKPGPQPDTASQVDTATTGYYWLLQVTSVTTVTTVTVVLGFVSVTTVNTVTTVNNFLYTKFKS